LLTAVEIASAPILNAINSQTSYFVDGKENSITEFNVNWNRSRNRTLESLRPSTCGGASVYHSFCFGQATEVAD